MAITCQHCIKAVYDHVHTQPLIVSEYSSDSPVTSSISCAEEVHTIIHQRTVRIIAICEHELMQYRVSTAVHGVCAKNDPVIVSHASTIAKPCHAI